MVLSAAHAVCKERCRAFALVRRNPQRGGPAMRGARGRPVAAALRLIAAPLSGCALCRQWAGATAVCMGPRLRRRSADGTRNARAPPRTFAGSSSGAVTLMATMRQRIDPAGAAQHDARREPRCQAATRHAELHLRRAGEEGLRDVLIEQLLPVERNVRMRRV